MTKSKKYWNYRIITHQVPETGATEAYRVFSVTEVHYENGEPFTYAPNINFYFKYNSIKDLKDIHKKVKNAFKNPILDIDNWPNEFKE